MIRYLALLLSVTPLGAADVSPRIPSDVDRAFVSGDIWTNPMEDWHLKEGRLFNIESGGDRNAVSLTSEIKAQGAFQISVKVDQLSEQLKGNGFVGFQLGVQGAQKDYRESAIYGAGVPAGINHDGRLFIGRLTKDAPVFKIPAGDFMLSLQGTQTADQSYQISLSAGDQKLQASKVHPSWVEGLVALTASSRGIHSLDLNKQRPPTSYSGVQHGRLPEEKGQNVLRPLSQGRGGDFRFAFSEWKLSGEAVKHHPDRSFGPIWWSTFTLDKDSKLRLVTQMAPVNGDVWLSIDGKTVSAAIDPSSHTAHFELPLSQTEKDSAYVIKYGDFHLSGVVPARPDGSEPITVASLSCNDSTGFPHNRLMENVTSHQPDVITFHGDQIYEGIGGYGFIQDQKASRRADLCYLRKYAMHGWTWRPLLTTRPSITIPDDHDVFHGNIWGEGGKLATPGKSNFEFQDSGGYKMSPEFVNMVHRTQVGNLPLPADQPKAKNGITTYFTSWQYGPIDFAIVADRQFKSAPKALLPKAQINNGWIQNRDFDAKIETRIQGAQLLGPLQEKFLDDWAGKEAPFKVLISQSPFLAPHTLPKGMHHDKDVPRLPVYKEGQGYPADDEPKPDFDTNGWPQDKRAIALRSLRKANALHIVGDQHLGTTGIYGIDSYDDGTWWIATPAIANVWPRRWMPAAPPAQPLEGKPRWLGGFEDGFGNKFTMHAVSNPWDIDRKPDRLFDRAVGYAITTYNTAQKTITLENWPYTSGKTKPAPDNKPYPGWPITVQQ